MLKSYFINFKDVNNLVILSIPSEEKIIMRFNLDKPETFNNITSLEILSNPEIEDSSSPTKDESVTIETQEQKVSIIEDADESQIKSETEDDAEELEADIVIDDIEEEELTIFQEATMGTIL